MSKQMWIRLVLGLAVVIFFSVLLVLMSARGGSLSGVVRIKDFTLCQSDIKGRKLEPLRSLVISPARVIYACGYLEIGVAYPGNAGLYYYLTQGEETVFRPNSYYYLPFHSQYFSFPITTTTLLAPGKYQLAVYEIGDPKTASVSFEVRPNP
ncbi:hypothetical protein TFLX_03538 [Thermoflexales bacterium]|nr:hypothetical protein TFLX_03538 [Thermoflexales bacterium]